MEIEGRPHGQNGPAERGAEFVRPDLLARTSQPHEHQGRAGLVNSGHRLVPFVRHQAAELRGLNARDPQRGKPGHQSLGQSVEQGLGSPEQKHGQLLLRRSLAGLQHQRGSVNAVRQLRAVQTVEGPAHGLAVRDHQVQGVQAMAMDRVQDARHHSVHGQRRDGKRAALTSGLDDPLDGPLVVHRIHEHAQNIALAAIDHSWLRKSDPPSS